MLDHILLLAKICLIALPFYLIIRRPWRFKGPVNRRRETVLCLFTVFMFGLLCLTFWAVYPPFDQLFSNAVFRLKNKYYISMTPFAMLRHMYLNDDREHFITNILGNTLMFIPWGFCRPLLWKKQKRFGAVFFGALLLTVFIETVQLFSYNRTVDIDDIILNAGASIFGSLLYFLAAAIWPGLKKLAK